MERFFTLRTYFENPAIGQNTLHGHEDFTFVSSSEIIVMQKAITVRQVDARRYIGFLLSPVSFLSAPSFFKNGFGFNSIFFTDWRKSSVFSDPFPPTCAWK